MTTAWSSPVRPAHVSASALNGGPSQRFALRRSAALYLATAVFIAVALAAVCATAASRFGRVHAAVAGITMLTILVREALTHFRHAPHVYKIGPDGLMFWDRDGILRAQGRITGCNQWSNMLLVVSLEDEGGRTHRVLIAADMLAPDAFRVLAVLARRGANL